MSGLLKQEVVGLRVQELRREAGLSLRRLAAATGFSPSFISQLENGQVSPSIASTQKIAAALGVTLGQFFAGVEGGGTGTVVRADERPTLSSGWSRAQIESLSAARPTGRLEATIVSLLRGGRSGKHPHAEPHEEFCLVLEGQLLLRLGPDEHTLREGDSVTILPGELRLWRNERARKARILVVAPSVGRLPVRRPRRRGPARPPAR